MGYAIAKAALDAGHDVILISGPVNLEPPRDTKLFLFRQVTKCSKQYSGTWTSLTFASSALRWRITGRLTSRR